MFFADRIVSIKLSDRVLEIGPGSLPHPRADVYLDKIFIKEEALAQNGYSATPESIQKKIIYYEDFPFPFKDKEFDYVICSHVLEHVRDVNTFINELCRIGKRGYLEFPTIYYDYLHNFDVHTTFLMLENGILKWMLKEETNLNVFKPVQSFFYTALELNKFEIVNNLKFFFFQGFEWNGIIEMRKANDLNEVCFSKEYIISNINSIGVNGISSGSFKNRIKKPFKFLLKVSKLLRSLITGEKNIKGLWNFRNEFELLKQSSLRTQSRFILEKKDWKLYLKDKTNATIFDRHYVYHPAWAIRILKQINPEVHIDISSSLHFCSVASAFFPIEFYDFRPPSIELSNLNVNHADLSNLFFKDNSIMSLSCMHTVEHVGLGRYGDAIDYDGDLKAMAELARVLAVNGNLLFVVPIGKKAVIRFNAHRVYTIEQIVYQFNKLGLTLKEFTLIPDNEIDGGLVTNPSTELLNKQSYGCGCFLFTK